MCFGYVAAQKDQRLKSLQTSKEEQDVVSPDPPGGLLKDATPQAAAEILPEAANRLHVHLGRGFWIRRLSA